MGLIQEAIWLVNFVKSCLFPEPSKPRVLKKTLWPKFLTQKAMITYSKMKPGHTYIWTDGSCKNDHSGGWSFLVIRDNKIVNKGAGHRRNTDSNKMELTAVLEALKVTTGRITIVTDSAYVCCGLRNYFVNGIRVDRDLWKQVFVLAIDKTRDIDSVWVKSHNGTHFNEEVDRMAQDETDKIYTGSKRKRRRKQ